MRCWRLRGLKRASLLMGYSSCCIGYGGWWRLSGMKAAGVILLCWRKYWVKILLKGALPVFLGTKRVRKCSAYMTALQGAGCACVSELKATSTTRKRGNTFCIGNVSKPGC